MLEIYLELKAFQNSCLATVAVATEIFQNGRRIQFSHIYITNEFGETHFFFIKSLLYSCFIDRSVFDFKKRYFSSLKEFPVTDFF